MKKTTKLLSILLAVLLMMTAIPFAATAKTLTTEGDLSANLDSLDLLLSLDHLGATPADGSTATYTPGVFTQNVELSDGTITSTVDGSVWLYYVGETNLSFDANSQYTIAFDAKGYGVPGTDTTDVQRLQMMAFAFALNESGDIGSTDAATTKTVSLNVDCRDNKRLFRAIPGNKWNNRLNDKDYAFSSLDWTYDVNTEYSYMIVIDKEIVSFYVDLQLVGTFALSGKLSGKALALGILQNNDRSSGDPIADMKNIRVYEGAAKVSNGEVNNYQAGDLLLQADTLFAPSDTNTWSSEFEDLTVGNSYTQNMTAGTGDNVNTAYLSAQGANNIGIQTNLPLNGTTGYTVSLSVKVQAQWYLNDGWIGVGFDIGGSNGARQGIAFAPQHVYMFSGSGAVNTSKTDFSGVWTDYRDQDGYTPIVLQINGYEVTAYVGGEEAGTFTFSSYNTSNLSITLRACSPGTNVNVGDAMFSVKDVQVFAGDTVVVKKTVNFEYNGSRLEYEGEPAIGDTIEAFPEISVAEDEVAVWFYKGTNVVATAPYKVLSNVTLEAKVFKNSVSSVEAMQLTVPSEANTQSVRFISVLQSLQGSETGFEITVKYMKDGLVTSGKTTVKKTNYVYSSINATTDGTVTSVTANSLGGSYLCALSVDGVPTNAGRIDFNVRSYVVINGEKVYSETVTFKLNNGIADSTLAPLN